MAPRHWLFLTVKSAALGPIMLNVFIVELAILLSLVIPAPMVLELPTGTTPKFITTVFADADHRKLAKTKVPNAIMSRRGTLPRIMTVFRSRNVA